MATDLEKIRLLIGDEVAPQHFTDVKLQVFSDIAGSVMLASALALEAWAAALTDAMESEHIGDYSYTKKLVSNKLVLAEKYRKGEAETPALAWSEMDLTGT